MKRTKKSKPLKGTRFILGILVLSIFWTPPSSAEQPWEYFPSRYKTQDSEAERLAIVSQGPGKSYTPGVYEIVIPKNPGYVDLSIWDAPTHEEISGTSWLSNVDYDPSKKKYSMDILFNCIKKIVCMDGSVEKNFDAAACGRLNVQSALCNGKEVFQEYTPGQAWEKGWSTPIRIYGNFHGSQEETTVMFQTVWKNHSSDELLTRPDVPNTINVFAFRTKYGKIRLKATKIMELESDATNKKYTEQNFRTTVNKIDYEIYVNWIFPYAIQAPTAPEFNFDLDVSNLTGDLIILDKDADSKVYGPHGNPPDDKVTMTVCWNNGVEDCQENNWLETWSNFDQTPRGPQAGYIAGETNSYQGPSWDNSQDCCGEKYIHWYKFSMENKKSNLVRVKWHNFGTLSNAFGLAANVPIQASKLALLLKTSIDSDPPPETKELKSKGIWDIRYFLTVENISQKPAEDVGLEISNPINAKISDETSKLFSQDGKTILLGSLSPGQKKTQTIFAKINYNAKNTATVSTKNKFYAKAKDMNKVPFSEVRHYLGPKTEQDPAPECDPKTEPCPPEKPPCDPKKETCEPEEEPCNPNTEACCDESKKNCKTIGILECAITSKPPPDPATESFDLDPNDPNKNKIIYRVTLKNKADKKTEETLKKVNLGFENPTYTTLDASMFSKIVPESGTGQYTGKGKGRFDLVETLEPQKRTTIDIPVIIDKDTGKTDFDISSENKLSFGAENNPKDFCVPLIHHVGKGSIDVRLSRCYAYNYFGGEFTCSDTCEPQEAGTIITVRDTLTNNGSSDASNYTYRPPPESPELEYQANSIRLDHPISGSPPPGDGATFPPPNGITITGNIPAGKTRTVFFKYKVPANIGGGEEYCLKPSQPIGTDDPPYTDLTYETACLEEKRKSKIPLICIIKSPEPKLKLEFSTIPSSDKTVYQGSIITYLLTIRNETQQPVKTLSMSGITPPQTSCIECASLNKIDPSELKEQFGELQYSSYIRVNNNAQGTFIEHPGFNVQFTGKSGKLQESSTSSIKHPLIAAPEPTGEFKHNIDLSRRLVLNAKERESQRDKDDGDRSVISHTMSYTGTKKAKVWSDFVGNNNLKWTRYPCRNFPVQYDAPFNMQIVVYNTKKDATAVPTLDAIPVAGVNFEVMISIPKNRPEFVFNDTNSSADKTIIKRSMDAKELNQFLKNGNIIPLDQDIIRSVADGAFGTIEVTNRSISSENSAGRINEDFWNYSRSGTAQCRECNQHGDCFPRNYDIYEWQYMPSGNFVHLSANDKDYITSLSSVAWLQTKQGNIGFGEPFWTQDPSGKDPNVVALKESDVIKTLMKFYTPPKESNADLFVLSPGGDPLKSRFGDKGKISVGSTVPLGFSQTGKLIQGEAYDRQQFPREFLDDLLVKELYGKVVHLNSQSLPSGMTKQGNIFQVSGTLSLQTDTIYHLKGQLIIGTKGGNDVVLDGGKSRLMVEGNALIYSNVRYSRSSGSLDNIPSVRLHTTGNISIDPSVKDIELMMLAEKEFHSGKSDQQLRILGDVITNTAFWERTPLQEDEGAVNKPSEIIYEDLRKYILTSPGDKKLWDWQNIWREVSPATGVPILEKILNPGK